MYIPRLKAQKEEPKETVCNFIVVPDGRKTMLTGLFPPPPPPPPYPIQLLAVDNNKSGQLFPLFSHSPNPSTGTTLRASIPTNKKTDTPSHHKKPLPSPDLAPYPLPPLPYQEEDGFFSKKKKKKKGHRKKEFHKPKTQTYVAKRLSSIEPEWAVLLKTPGLDRGGGFCFVYYIILDIGSIV